MATVRISKKLLDEVDVILTSMRVAAVREAAGEMPSPNARYSTMPAKDQELLLSAVWGDHAKLIPLLPTEWKTTCNRIEVSVRVDEPTGPTRYSFYIECDHSMQVWPPIGGSYRKVVVQPDHPLIKDWVDRTREYRTVKMETEKQFKVVEEGVKKLLTNSKSANDAIKKWEGIKMYMPKWVLEEVDRKMTRTKTEEVDELDVDFGALAVAAASHRMGNSTS